MGLTPYTFTASRHLTFTLTLGLIFWRGYVALRFIKDITHRLAHLVPLGTPYALMPFMVLIELIRGVIRPLTLSVRLAANIVAGHLLMTLIAGPISASGFAGAGAMLSGLVLLTVLESAVALIQAYVFSMLSTLYLNEVNFTSINYLCSLRLATDYSTTLSK